jgi:transposase
MIASERERLHVMRALSKGLLQAWRREGDAGLISRQRGRRSPRRMDEAKRARIEALLRTKYPADRAKTRAAEMEAATDQRTGASLTFRPAESRW